MHANICFPVNLLMLIHIILFICTAVLNLLCIFIIQQRHLRYFWLPFQPHPFSFVLTLLTSSCILLDSVAIGLLWTSSPLKEKLYRFFATFGLLSNFDREISLKAIEIGRLCMKQTEYYTKRLLYKLFFNPSCHSGRNNW